MSNTTVLPLKAKRDSRVELLRLFACFAVLVLHFKPGTFVGGSALLSRTFVTCLCTDAVGIFLLITGFFFFGKQSYGRRIVVYAQRILLPTLAYTLFVAIIYPAMIGSPVDYRGVAAEFATTLLTWNPIIHNAQHLWYMYLYGMLVLACPLLRWVKEHWLTTPVRQAGFLVGTLVFLAANDLCGNRILNAQMIPATVFIPGCLFVLAGSVLYEHRFKVQGNVLSAVVSLMVFASVTAVRSVYMKNALDVDASATHMYGWYTSAGFLCAAALAVFVLSLKPFASTVINALASNTMEIYILHVIVSEVLSAMGLRSWVVATFLDGSERFIQYLKFTAIYSLLIFVVCSAVAAAIKAVFALCKKQIRQRWDVGTVEQK